MDNSLNARTDAELMAAIRDGDLGAFGELVERHQDALVNFFYRNCWDRYLAEDFAQEVFLRLLKASRSYAPTGSFKTFMYSIARNYWIDHLRAKRKERHVSLQSSVGGEDETRFVDLLESSDPGPGEKIGRMELGREILKALDSLPEEQKMVFVLCQVDGLRYSDVADIQGVPLGTVKSRMHAALEKLKILLEGKIDG